STGRTVYVLDEPTTGLHFEDIRKLLAVLQSLVDKGNTVIVIEHNLDVIKSADWLIDMGPEGGHKGGAVVAAGTPEEVAELEDSYTGQFLRPSLGLQGPASNDPAARDRAAKSNNGNGAKAAATPKKALGSRARAAAADPAPEAGSVPKARATATKATKAT